MKYLDAWPRLETRARWLLEHPDQIAPLEAVQDLTLELRLWRRRGRTHVSWGLFVPGNLEDRALVRETTWDESADRRRWRFRESPLKRRPAGEPTIHVRDAFVGRRELRPFLVEASGMLPTRAPPVESSPDEDRFGIEGYRPPSDARLEWNGRGPEEFGEAIAWTGRLRRLLERALREREISSRS